MATTIKLKNSVTTTNAPSSLVQGEVAINITDKKVWVGNAATTPIQLLGDGASLNFTSLSLSGNLTFTGTGNRITGDFSNATQSNRVAFQTSTTNGSTIVTVLPNGTGTTSVFNAINNSDPTNASITQIVCSSTESAIRAQISGTGTYLPLTFQTNNAERLRIDTSGNVLVNTTGTGADGLNIAAGKNISFAEGSGVSYANIFRQSSSAALVLAMGYKYTATASGFASSVGTSIAKSAISLGTVAGGITFYADAAVTTANGTDVTPTERMRITSGGNVLVGTTDVSLTTGIGYKYAASATDPYIGIVQQSSTNSNTNYHLYSTGAAAYRFYVGLAGTIYATSTTITALSDARLKENIQDIDVGLDKVMALKPRKFDWKDGKGKDKKGDRGWIAQEFEQVFPDMIDTWKDPAPEGEEPYKSVNADLIPVLVKAIQEQQAMIETLKAEVALLKSK